MHIRSFLSSSKNLSGITIKGGSSSSGTLTKISLDQIQTLKKDSNFIMYFRDGKMRFDFSQERNYAEDQSVDKSNAVYLDDISSIKGDGKTDDTAALRSVLEKAKGYVIGNKDKTYLVNTSEAMNAKGIGIAYMNFKSTKPTTLLNIRGGKNNFIIHNCNFDGGRGSFQEKWQVFSSYYGKESCQPSTKTYIQAIGNQGRIIIRDCKFKNIFARKVLGIGSKGDGVVFYKDLEFHNVASRTFHGWNDKDSDTGVQFAFDIYADGAGILPSTFIYKNGNGQTVEMKRDSSNCPYPQNSFGNIVSFGTFVADNVKGDNMASCGIGIDHNKLAITNDISIYCDDSRLKTNNPYGAYWIEYSKTVFAQDVKIVIDKRGGDIGDTSLLALAGRTNSIIEMQNVRVTSAQEVSKLVRLSSKGGVSWGLSKLKVDDDSNSEAKGVSHGYLSSASQKDNYLHITRDSNIEAYRMRFQPVNDLLIQETTMNLRSGFKPLSYDSGVSGISKKQNRIRINDNKISGDTVFDLPIDTLEFQENAVSGSLEVNCDISQAKIKNNDIDGKSSINSSRISSLDAS